MTIGDMVRAQKELVDHLGIRKLLCVTGGSMGGMQALQWAVSYPEMVRSCIPIATTSRLSAQGIAFDEVGRQAIMADQNWHGGDYYGRETPLPGLAVARMLGHITYLSDESMHQKFGRRLRDKEKYGYDFSTDFEVESYLRHQGDSFIRALRRQQLPVHHQGDRLLRPGERRGGRWRRHSGASRRGSW